MSPIGAKFTTRTVTIVPVGKQYLTRWCKLVTVTSDTLGDNELVFVSAHAPETSIPVSIRLEVGVGHTRLDLSQGVDEVTETRWSNLRKDIRCT